MVGYDGAACAEERPLDFGERNVKAFIRWSGLSRREKDRLSNGALNADQIRDIELTLKRNTYFRGRPLIFMTLIIVGGLTAEHGLTKILTFSVAAPVVSGWDIFFTVVGAILYFGTLFSILTTSRTWLVNGALRALARGLSDVNKAIGTPPLSSRRKSAARKLDLAARRIRALGPSIPITFSGRALKKALERLPLNFEPSSRSACSAPIMNSRLSRSRPNLLPCSLQQKTGPRLDV